jgi:hypothetical protein
MMADVSFHQKHPYSDPSVNVDEWIDCFRSVFMTAAGKRALLFLAKHWHFIDRTLPSEEWKAQRQCFVDLLGCCGMTQDDVIEQLLGHMLDNAPRTKRRPTREDNKR